MNLCYLQFQYFLETIINSKSKLPLRVVREDIEERKVILVPWTSFIFLFWSERSATLILHKAPWVLCLGAGQLRKQGVWAAQMNRIQSVHGQPASTTLCLYLPSGPLVLCLHVVWHIVSLTIFFCIITVMTKWKCTEIKHCNSVFNFLSTLKF